MSASRTTRTSRRVASRRTAILDSDEEQNTNANSTTIKSEADSASLLSVTSRRQTGGGRRSVAPIAAGEQQPRRRGRPRKTQPPDIPPKIEDEPKENALHDEKPDRDHAESSTLSSTPPRRESVVPQAALAATPSLLPPTTTPLKSHDAPSPTATRLADITATSVNVQSAEEIRTAMKPVKPFETIMDKPIDIMFKQRTVTIPTIEEPSTPKSRIVLTHLILINFKSYAGRQEVGPFHTSFSSVVGPNGSGKSNVIDSLLFVFGFRASKMRQGKISALIHNSSQHPNLDHCEVEVHFQEVIDQPGGTHHVVPDSKIIISRKAFSNNSSKYYINGKESNFTTVTTLLRERGVDLDHKRFLILQGEVESIAQMKPKAANEHDDGLLEYLEDIIGTSKYKSPIEETAIEVETLNEVCMEKSGRVQHVEKEKQSLEEKKEKALAYVKDENELTMKQSALYQIHLRECDDKALVTEEDITQIQIQLDDELAKHQGSEKIIKNLEKEFSLGSKDLEAREKQAQILAKELAKFEQERVKFEEKRKFLEGKTKKLEKSMADAEGALAEADETIEQCQHDIQARTQDNTSLEEQVKVEEIELAKIRDSLKGKTQVYSDQIAAKQKQLEPWTEKINQKQAAISIAESEMKILQDKANAGAVAVEELTAKMASIEEGRAAKSQELASCEEEKEALSKEAKKMESELQVLAEQEPKMRIKISNARQKADEARSSLASTQARGTVLTALLRMKESGRIDGFHGRLGNLGTIDAKYDIAISTACPSLDNFVTDTVEAGQQCIKYLRKNNLGRGNFICLDRLRARDTSPISTPENAPRLFDLVRTKDDRFRPAFYHALQYTLVATDLTQANRIAYGAKRWPVVTLAGELIDKSGTMSGGGTTVNKGLMSSKIVADVSKEQIDKLESDQEGWETKLQELQEYQRECEGKLKDLNERLPQLNTRMQKIRLEMESAAKNILDTKRRIKEVSKEQQPSNSDSSRIRALQKEITALQSDIEQLHSETASVNEEIQALQSKIMEIGGERLRAQRSKVDELKAEMSSHSDEISASEVRKVKAEKHKQKLSKDFAKAEVERSSAAKDLEKLENDICNQGDKAKGLEDRVATAQEDSAAKKRDLADFKKELDEKTAELNASRAVEIEMRNKLEESQKVLAENRKQLAYWTEKLSKLALHNIEDLGGPIPSPANDTKTDGQEEAGTDETVGHEKAEGSDEDVDMTDAPSTHAENEELPAVQSMNDLPKYTPDELADMSKETLKDEIEELEGRIQNVSVDLAVLAEYRRRVEEHASRSLDLQSAISRRDAAKNRCDDLRRSRLEGFMEGFRTISLRLKEMYQMITMGGNAELELVDSLDPFSEGILFSVMPPKKSWKNISNLSGGEKTLSSLALVFALHHYKPTPLYVMDEIDAALDFRNVSIVANYIKERTKNAQFIVISLRNNMFELAARLVGVYKVNHMTKSVTIENKEFIARPLPAQRPVGNGLTTTLALR